MTVKELWCCGLSSCKFFRVFVLFLLCVFNRFFMCISMYEFFSLNVCAVNDFIVRIGEGFDTSDCLRLRYICLISSV